MIGLLEKDQETLHLYWLPTNYKLKVFCPSSSKEIWFLISLFASIIKYTEASEYFFILIE